MKCNIAITTIREDVSRFDVVHFCCKKNLGMTGHPSFHMDEIFEVEVEVEVGVEPHKASPCYRRIPEQRSDGNRGRKGFSAKSNEKDMSVDVMRLGSNGLSVSVLADAKMKKVFIDAVSHWLGCLAFFSALHCLH